MSRQNMEQERASLAREIDGDREGGGGRMREREREGKVSKKTSESDDGEWIEAHPFQTDIIMTA
jgi:hypothetical protein